MLKVDRGGCKMASSYTLFKLPVQLEMLAVVRYLHHAGHAGASETFRDLRETSSGMGCGEFAQHRGRRRREARRSDSCIAFLENKFGVHGLVELAQKFADEAPEYRITN